jgi:hypothetical protein
MAQVAQDGIYSVWQGSKQVGQLVSQAGVEYWWLGSDYIAPRLEMADEPAVVIVTYTLESVDLSGFDPENPQPPLGSLTGPTSRVTATGTLDATGADYPFFVDKTWHPTMQVDPMSRPGYIGIYNGQVDPKKPDPALLLGQLVALLETPPPPVVGPNPPPAPKAVQEHWFLAQGQSQYPTTVGATKTVTFLGFLMKNDPPWWVQPISGQKPPKGTFRAGLFSNALERSGPHVFVDCDWYPPTADG